MQLIKTFLSLKLYLCMYSSSLVITSGYLKKISVIMTMSTMYRPACYVLIWGNIQSDIN